MAGTITWTHTDESPALASKSLLPIVKHFLAAAHIKVEQLDISFSGRILQEFSDYLNPSQQLDNAIEALKKLTEKADTNIIKLPNASATDNQLRDAIKELQSKGFALPDYPSAPNTPQEEIIKSRYDKLTGSVVNPVLRQGNAVRSIPKAVKEAARANPHALGQWKASSKTRVASMDHGDFFDTEKSLTTSAKDAGQASIRFRGDDGSIKTLGAINIQDKDIIDTAVMRRDALNDFIVKSMDEAKNNGLLLSLHLKATMMKKTDGIIFGAALKQYFKPVFDKFEKELASIGFNPENGMDDLLKKMKSLPQSTQDQMQREIDNALQNGPSLAMANVRAGTHHLSSPNNVIVDVSMANLARWGGEVPAKDGSNGDTLAVLPDSTYAKMHQSGIDFLKANGAPMGTVTALRLQAEGAEEYGSKNSTFSAPSKGVIEVVNHNGDVMNSQSVETGDIWRLCRTSDKAIQNWIDLADEYAQSRNDETIFWLDQDRAHDREVIAKIKARPQSKGLSRTVILSPADAMHRTLERSYAGQNTTCVTGNLIGDHITDYFPILEIGSSSKMLSVIKLLNGGLVAETGSGGTAPDLLSILEDQNHLLWDDMGTALALVEALRHLSVQCKNVQADILADTLETATQRYINDNRSPAPNGMDARQSHFYLAKYWAEELSTQQRDIKLQQAFAPTAKKLGDLEQKIIDQIDADKGKPTKLGGRYYLESDQVDDIMRPTGDYDL